MKKIILLFVLTVFAVNGHAQFIVAEDKAENYNTWTNGNNQGIGFGNWDMWTEGSGGWFIGSSSSYGFGNIDTNSKSFGMSGYPSGTNYSNAQRILSNYWGDGATFSIQLAIAYTNGNKGIDLFGTGLEKIWNFNVGSGKYQIEGVAQNWSYSQTSVFTLSAKQNGQNIDITLTRGSNTYTKTINGKTLYAFKLYNGSTDNNGNLNNLFFNNLKISYSDWSKVPSNIKVKIEGNGTLNANKTVSDLEINSEVTASVAAGKQLTITGTATNNGTIKLLSNGTDGTATLVGNVGGNAEVNQAITSLPRTYYAGIPVAVTSTTGITNVATFTESTDLWSALSTNTAGTMTTPGQGYLIQVPSATNISFTGALNTGDKTVGLTIGNKKYNFLGNPYPSYLDGQKVVDASTNVEKSIWYRTKTGASTYGFVTYNVPTGVSIPATAANNGFIPPMQGFWLKAKAAGNYTFTNTMRTHNTTGTAIPLKAPKAAVNQILRLQVTNGTALDEAVMLFNENAQNGYDSYDAAKMMNTGTGVLNIYTVLGTENLVLNSQPAITYDVEIPVGMNLAAGTYTVSANEFSNFAEGTKAQLLDKATGTLTDLTTASYNFTLTEALNSNTRFALVFPQNAPTGVDNAGAGDVTVFTRSSRIVVSAGEAAQGSMIYVFNGVGQRLAAQAVSGTVNEIGRTFPAGVYVVKVNNVTAKVVVK